MSATASMLRPWVLITPGALIFFCCVLWGRGHCDELITLPEDSYRLWWVVGRDLEISWIRRTWPTGDCRAKNNKDVDNENKFRLNFVEKRLNGLSTLSIANGITIPLSYVEARRAKNIQPKNVENKVLQRSIRQLINKNINLCFWISCCLWYLSALFNL